MRRKSRFTGNQIQSLVFVNLENKRLKKTVFQFQMSNVGHNLKEEMERVLIMISQFAFIHGDTNLLCLALLRRPQEPPLTLSGFAALQRSLLSKTLAFVLLVMLLIANYKMDDYSKSTDGDSFFDKLTKIN